MLKQFFRSKRNIAFVVGGAALMVVAAIFSVFLINNPTTPEPNAEISEEHTVTRAEWIDMLTNTMKYNKFNDAEAYFDDVSISDADYDSVQIAVAYNLIAVDSGHFKPDDKATREFVAVTTVKAVGFFGEPSAMLNDVSELPDADSIRLAVDNNIFVCPDGNFNPNVEITPTECNDIIRKIKAITTVTIDPNHEDSIVYADGIVDLSKSTNTVTYNDGAAMSIQIAGEDAASLKAGSVYLLPPSPEYPYGVARKVKSIALDGDSYIIENEEPTIEEIISSMDIQGEFYPDYSNIIWAEGVTGEFVPDSIIAPTAAWPSDIKIQTMNLRPNNLQIQPMAKFEDSASGSLNCSLNVNKGNNKISGTFQIALKASLNINADFLAAKIHTASLLVEETHTLSLAVQTATPDAHVSLCKIPIPIGPTGISIMINVTFGVNGEIVLSFDAETSAELGFSVVENRPSVHGRIVESNQQFGLAANGKLGFKIKPALNFWGLDAADAGADIGACLKLEPVKPCFNLDMYNYFSLEASLFPSILKNKLSVSVDIWTEENSPKRETFHYEDGKFVLVCTKMGKTSETIDLKNTYSTKFSKINAVTYPSFSFDYPDGWTVSGEGVSSISELVELTNGEGVIVRYQYIVPSRAYGSMNIEVTSETSKVADSSFIPSYSQTTDYSDLGNFVIAKIKTISYRNIKTDPEPIQSDSDYYSYAVMPESECGSHTRDGNFNEAFWYDGLLQFVTVASRTPTSKEEQEIIAILASFRINPEDGEKDIQGEYDTSSEWYRTYGKLISLIQDMPIMYQGQVYFDERVPGDIELKHNERGGASSAFEVKDRKLVYSLVDMKADGVPELLIGAQSAGNTSIWAVYEFENHVAGLIYTNSSESVSPEYAYLDNTDVVKNIKSDALIWKPLSEMPQSTPPSEATENTTKMSGNTFTHSVYGHDLKLPIEYKDKLEFKVGVDSAGDSYAQIFYKPIHDKNPNAGEVLYMDLWTRSYYDNHIKNWYNNSISRGNYIEPIPNQWQISIQRDTILVALFLNPRTSGATPEEAEEYNRIVDYFKNHLDEWRTQALQQDLGNYDNYVKEWIENR